MRTGMTVDCGIERFRSEAELRPMVLADPHSLDKPERGAQPLHCRAHIRVDEDRNDGGLRDRAVALHGWRQTKHLAIRLARQAAGTMNRLRPCTRTNSSS